MIKKIILEIEVEEENIDNVKENISEVFGYCPYKIDYKWK